MPLKESRARAKVDEEADRQVSEKLLTEEKKSVGSKKTLDLTIKILKPKLIFYETELRSELNL